MIYFDNAATSGRKPISVIIKTTLSMLRCANPGRSGHSRSLKVAGQVFEVRAKLKSFFNVPYEDGVIFTQNCTLALNLAIVGCAKSGGHIICSCFEHNSVLRVLNKLQSDGKITYSVVYPKNNESVTVGDIEPLIRHNTYMICLIHTTNTTGTTHNIESIGKLCKDRGLLFLVDAAQSAGHQKIDMQKANINLLAFAGHKGLFAPQSIGGLCINNANPSPIIFGGTGTSSIDLNQPDELPEKYESGTVSAPLIIGLGKGVEYVNKNFDKHQTRVKALTKYLLKNLTQIKDIVLLSPPHVTSGVVLFNIKNYSSTEVADYLNNHGIAVRSGLHCAPLAHKFLGTEKTGAVRISLNHFNKKCEINKLIKTLKKLNNSLQS